MRGMAFLAGASLISTLAGCATVARPTVFGRHVEVKTSDGSAATAGELLAVQDGQLVLRTDRGPEPLPLSTVSKVRIKRHDWGGQRGFVWTLIGGVVTGAALSSACGQVSTGCGSVGARVFALWLVVGGLSSVGMEHASHFDIARPTPDALRPFARFPQGLPEGWDQTSSTPGKK